MAQKRKEALRAGARSRRPIQTATALPTSLWMTVLTRCDLSRCLRSRSGRYQERPFERLGASDRRPVQFMGQKGQLTAVEVTHDSIELSGGARAPPLIHFMYKHV